MFDRLRAFVVERLAARPVTPPAPTEEARAQTTRTPRTPRTLRTPRRRRKDDYDNKALLASETKRWPPAQPPAAPRQP